MNGLKTDYFFNATKNDLKNVLIDTKFESVVLVGHGSMNGWKATDKYVSNDDINQWKDLFEAKKGEWFQLTCAARDTYPEHIGELAMSDLNNVYRLERLLFLVQYCSLCEIEPLWSLNIKWNYSNQIP